MAEYKQKNKGATSQEEVETEEIEAKDQQELTDSVDEILAEIEETLDESPIDELLDEIDDMLEENAEEFVAAFIQKGGE